MTVSGSLTGGGQVDKRTEEAIERLVADWPELTEETKDRLRELLGADDDPYRRLVRKVAESRPPLTEEQLRELTELIRMHRERSE